MHIINNQLFFSALAENGYPSIQALAKKLGIHRNTIHHYLSGNSVLPDKLELLMQELGLSHTNFIIPFISKSSIKYNEIESLIGTLTEQFPNYAFILFGSRARGNNHKYSDYDIGVYSKSGLNHNEYLKMIELKEELVEDLPFFVDLINLNTADTDFLKRISNDWKFISGNLKHWIDIQKKVLND